MSERVVLAVDGGNSKTYLALLRADGELLSLVRGTQSSPHHLGGEGCLRVLDELLGLAQHVAAYERLAVGAALSGNPADVRKALLAHPLIGQWEATDELVDRLLAADAAQLPRFAGSRGAPA